MTLVSAFDCPEGYEPGSLKFKTKDDYTLEQWGSRDDVGCALYKTKAKCFKPNGRRKRWLTFNRGGFGEYVITKNALFSVTPGFNDTTATTTTTTATGTTQTYTTTRSTSTSTVERYFAIRALSFRVRGAIRIVIEFDGVIKNIVSRARARRDNLSS